MTTSGTTAFELDIASIIEEAFEQAGVEMRSGYQFRTARRSLDLLSIEWANRGYNLWLIDSSTFTTTSGTISYNLDTDVADVIDAVIVQDDIETILRRIPAAQYMRISNKTSEGVPSLIWVNRQLTRPVAYLWQVPDSTYTVKYWHLRRIEDSSGADYTPDVPWRFVPALIAGLAHKLAMKEPGAGARIDMLAMEAERQFDLAAQEDRERTSFYIRPRISY
jgi:hypothetical protein